MKSCVMGRLIGAALVACAMGGAAHAKLPAPGDEQKAKAAEAKAKSDEAAKRESDLLVKTQDRVAEHYRRTRGTSPKR